ncbi:MAG: hypothetical protein LBP28_06320 [Coriobacteriales bacterium]|jgi:hypothetical protein|nr:hypothetical protein [Coriobacteriales bacterium]
MTHDEAPAEDIPAATTAPAGVAAAPDVAAAAPDVATAAEETQNLIDLNNQLTDEQLQQIIETFAGRVRSGTDAAGLLATAGDFSDLRQLRGNSATYWYSERSMTDNYARWAMLAREDNAAQTLVECAREESRVYPRPLSADSLANAPFHLSQETLEAAFERVRESGDFPDIERLQASNGDVYYFSTEHLKRGRAEALAEYYSVDIHYNV